MTPARMVWAINLCLMVALLAVLAAAVPAGWVAALPLIIVLPWLIRSSSYAHAVLSLMIVGYVGVGLAFRDHASALLVACLGAGVFLTCTAYVRFAAVERRRANAVDEAGRQS